MKKIAVDCRMINTDNIGNYLKGIIPFFITKSNCLLLGTHDQCMNYLRLQNVEFCYCPIEPFSFKERHHFPKDILKKINGYDYFFTPSTNIPGGIKIPIISTILNSYIFNFGENIKLSPNELTLKHSYKNAISCSSKIITISDFTKQAIKNKYKCTIPIITAYTGISEYTDIKDDTLDFFSKKPNEKIILFISTFQKNNGFETLIKAFLATLKKGINAKLYIISTRTSFINEKTYLSENIEDIPSDSIVFQGNLSKKQMFMMYKRSDIFVNPSFYDDFGITILEALKNGRNVIASDIPVYKEIYMNFPLTFFKAGNSNNLTEKLIQCCKSNDSITKVPDLYNFNKTAVKILDAILNS